MPSKRQIQANQNNAQQSTGPQTPEGKAVCAGNAITHGFSAQGAVLPSESSQDFQALLAKFEEEFRPETALEESLVRQLADTDWRLRRVATFETAVLLQRVEKVRQFTAKYEDELPEDPALDEICLLGRALINDAAGSDPLSKISRHEARLTRRYFKALAQLRKTRKTRTPRDSASGRVDKQPQHDVPEANLPAPNIPTLLEGKQLVRDPEAAGSFAPPAEPQDIKN